MTSAIVALLAVGAALLQVGAMPTLVFATTETPLLPIALLVAWGTVRRPVEVWPALILAAVTLGMTSEQRTGWYLLALLPTGIALLAPGAPVPVQQRAPQEHRTFLGRIARAPAAAAAGAWAYLALLLVAGGDASDLPGHGVELVVAALWTGALAIGFALLLWPLRPRQRGLFL